MKQSPCGGCPETFDQIHLHCASCGTHYPNATGNSSPCPECGTVPRWFASPLEYALARRCATCGAAPGVDCDAPNKAARRDRWHRQHATRIDAGNRHYNRDVGNAPWIEHRTPGRCYSTIRAAHE